MGRRLSGDDQAGRGDPPGDPLDSLFGFVPQGNIVHGDVELLVELVQGSRGGVLQAGDLGAEAVIGLAVVAVCKEYEVVGGCPCQQKVSIASNTAASIVPGVMSSSIRA